MLALLALELALAASIFSPAANAILAATPLVKKLRLFSFTDLHIKEFPFFVYLKNKKVKF